MRTITRLSYDGPAMLTANQLFTASLRVELGTVDVEVLWRDAADGSTVGGALIDGDYDFGSGDRLRAIRVSLGAK